MAGSSTEIGEESLLLAGGAAHSFSITAETQPKRVAGPSARAPSPNSRPECPRAISFSSRFNSGGWLLQRKVQPRISRASPR